ncbi:hypothetical protein N9C48_01510 [bacterium]|jgi:hypothetical protein|nr:hypothetical protein [bacterium]
MYLRELTSISIDEGATSIYGRKGNQSTRKYRCSSGPRKGRIVAKMSTCTAPKNIKKATTLKKVKRAGAKRQAVKTARTKRANPASRRLPKVNISMRTNRKKSKAKRI